MTTSALNCSANEAAIPPSGWYYVESRWQFLTALYALLIASAFVNLGVFLAAKQRKVYERLRVRRSTVVWMSFLLCLIHAQAGPGFVVIGIPIFPCWLRMTVSLVLIPIYVTVMVVRVMVFFFMNKLSQNAAELDQLQNMGGEDEEQVAVAHTRRRGLGCGDLFDAFLILLQSSYMEKLSKERLIRALSFSVSTRGNLYIFAVILSPTIAAIVIFLVSNPYHLAGCTGCELTGPEIYWIVGNSLIILILFFFTMFKVRHYPDPWKLRREVSLIGVCGFIILVGFILATFMNPAQSVPYDHQLIIVAPIMAMMFLQSGYQVIMAHIRESKSSKRRRQLQKKRSKNRILSDLAVSPADEPATTYQGSTGIRSELNLEVIMSSKELLGLFEQYLVEELGVESLMFLRDTENWIINYYDISKTARIARAKRIYDFYINPSGQLPVNIPWSMIQDVKRRLHEEGMTDIGKDVFDTSRDEIRDLLQAGAVGRFELSTAFIDFKTRNPGQF